MPMTYYHSADNHPQIKAVSFFVTIFAFTRRTHELTQSCTYCSETAHRFEYAGIKFESYGNRRSTEPTSWVRFNAIIAVRDTRRRQRPARTRNNSRSRTTFTTTRTRDNPTAAPPPRLITLGKANGNSRRRNEAAAADARRVDNVD